MKSKERIQAELLKQTRAMDALFNAVEEESKKLGDRENRNPDHYKTPGEYIAAMRPLRQRMDEGKIVETIKDTLKWVLSDEEDQIIW